MKHSHKRVIVAALWGVSVHVMSACVCVCVWQVHALNASRRRATARDVHIIWAELMKSVPVSNTCILGQSHSTSAPASVITVNNYYTGLTASFTGGAMGGSTPLPDPSHSALAMSVHPTH